MLNTRWGDGSGLLPGYQVVESSETDELDCFLVGNLNVENYGFLFVLMVRGVPSTLLHPKLESENCLVSLPTTASSDLSWSVDVGR